MQAYIMAHPWLTFFAFCAVLTTLRVVVRGWPSGRSK